MEGRTAIPCNLQRFTNGINVSAARDLVKLIEQDSDQARYRFTVHNEWVDGAYTRSIISRFYNAKGSVDHARQFVVVAGRPPALTGHDRGPSPFEHLLNALAACMTDAMVYHAATHGIRIEELESDVEGDIDIRGALGLSEHIQRGYQAIRVRFQVKTDEEELGKLKAFSMFSPVYDSVSRGTPIEITVVRKG